MIARYSGPSRAVTVNGTRGTTTLPTRKILNYLTQLSEEQVRCSFSIGDDAIFFTDRLLTISPHCNVHRVENISTVRGHRDPDPTNHSCGFTVIVSFRHRRSHYGMNEQPGSETMLVTGAICFRTRSDCTCSESSSLIIQGRIGNLPCVGGSIQMPIAIAIAIEIQQKVPRREDEHVQGKMQGKEGQGKSLSGRVEWEHQPSFVFSLAVSAVRYDSIVHRPSSIVPQIEMQLLLE